ncbi:uncharacterized protein LOC141626989 [Silene latifolia]|uniref:uncharacterized protein LOC141626989 n=1 Tax=Silene latifolia TaxID=37657 RepID=UPI003D776C81
MIVDRQCRFNCFIFPVFRQNLIKPLSPLSFSRQDHKRKQKEERHPNHSSSLNFNSISTSNLFNSFTNSNYPLSLHFQFSPFPFYFRQKQSFLGPRVSNFWVHCFVIAFKSSPITEAMESAGKRRKLTETRKTSTRNGAAGASGFSQPVQRSRANSSSSGSGSTNLDASGTAIIPRAVITRFPEHPNVIFSSEGQRESFKKLCEVPVIPTHFVDDKSLDKLGWRAPVLELLNGTGTRRLATMLHYTYESLTYKFFSSFRYVAQNNAKNIPEIRIHFRLLNKDYKLTFTQFGGYLGVASAGSTTPPRDEATRALWPALYHGPRDRHYINDVDHPIPRFWFRLVVGTIFGRPDPNKLNVIERHMLAGFLNVDYCDPFVLNVAQAVATHFNTFRAHRVIQCGGNVSHLASRLIPGFPPDHLKPIGHEVGLSSLQADRLLNLPALASFKWIRTIPSLQRKLEGEKTLPLPLPCNAFPAIVPMPKFDPTLDPTKSRPPTPSFLLLGGQSSGSTKEASQSSGNTFTPIVIPTITFPPPPPPSTRPQPTYPAHFIKPPQRNYLQILRFRA